jgi:hypothetical protein
VYRCPIGVYFLTVDLLSVGTEGIFTPGMQTLVGFTQDNLMQEGQCLASAQEGKTWGVRFASPYLLRAARCYHVDGIRRPVFFPLLLQHRVLSRLTTQIGSWDK